jgi:hypothetical protein
MSCEVYREEEPQTHSQHPYKSLRLYAPVPARYDAHCSVYRVSCLFPGHK